MNLMISTSTQMAGCLKIILTIVTHQQSKGKLTRVHSDTSTIQNVLTQFQDVKKNFPEKSTTPKLVKKNGVDKSSKPITNLNLKQSIKETPTDSNQFIISMNSNNRINSQETPESARIQSTNFMIRDQYKGQPTKEIAQGYQGSQKSVIGNNVSASSIHNINQNGSVHINNNLSQ